MIWLGLFVLSFLADVFCVWWSNATKPKDRRWWSAIRAGLISLALASEAMFSTISYINDQEYAIPILLGLFLGAVFAVRREQHKLPKPEHKLVEWCNCEGCVR